MSETQETTIAVLDTIQSIAPARRSILTISDQQVSRIKILAEMMAASKSQLEYRKMNAGDIFIKMMKGLEVGLEPVASMDLIDVIQGKPTLKPQGMLALAHDSRQISDILITDDGDTCTVKMKRGEMAMHIETFSQKDAVAMGLAGKDNWKKQPAVMRKWRAVSAACRVVFPDIIQGMYIPEELSPDTIVDDSGGIIDAQFSSVTKQVSSQPPPVKDIEPESAANNGDRPAVYVGKFTHMCYEIASKTCLKLANCLPADNQGDPDLTIIRGYGRSSTLRKLLGEYVYEVLNLARYDAVKKTTKWVKMPIDVELEYIEVVDDKGKRAYFKAVGVAHSEAQPQEELPPVTGDFVPSPPTPGDEIPF